MLLLSLAFVTARLALVTTGGRGVATLSASRPVDEGEPG